MNDSYLAYQAHYLHDSLPYKALISIKLLLGLIAAPLLWKIRGYKRKVLAHESLSILMRFHYYYIFIFVVLGTADYSITIYKFQSSDPSDYILSWLEMFMRRYPQVVMAHGTVSSMCMMALERFAASRKFQTYESSRRNTVFFWTHIALMLIAVPPAIMSYDLGAKYAASTLVPENGQIYHQIIGAPLGLLELLTIATFEYSYRLNKNRLQKDAYTLSERYQIAENIRMLEILRPIANFHGALTCYGTLFFVLFGRDLKDGPNYPIFEECFNILVLQGIVLPLIFIRHERLERQRKVTQLEQNRAISDDFVARYTAQITRGW